MDPASLFGLAASLTQLTGQVLIAFTDYVSSVKGAPASVDRLKKELTAISVVLTEISNLAAHGVTMNSAVTVIVTDCQKTLQMMLEELTRLKLKEQNASTLYGISWERLKWPFREKKITGWAEMLEGYKATISLHLHTQTVVGVSKIESRGRWAEVVQARTEHEGKRQQLIAWLSPLPYNNKQSQTSDRRQTGTGDWLFEQQAYKSWEDGQVNALWIYGIPGSGKTFLTSKVIDRLLNDAGVHQYTLAYCYCDFTENAAIMPVNIIHTVLVQMLAMWDTNSPDQFPDLFSMLRLGQGPPSSIPALVKLAERCLELACHNRVFLVIDALDECTNREDLLQFICAIALDKRVHILVTSRHEQDIIEQLSGSFSTISLSDHRSNLLTDMRQHLAEELKTPKWSHLHHRKNSVMKQELEETLFKDSERNMFRWLQCQLDTLARHKSNNTLRKALKNLPPDLFRAYERILLGIDTACMELAYKTLLWLATSPRRMTIDELVEALAIHEGQTTLDHDATVNDALHLVRICGSLVEYDEGLRSVNLTHATVKDFLYWDGLQSNPRLSYYALEHGTANSMLGKLTLTYLLLDDFAGGPCHNYEEFHSRMSKFPLYRYCVEAYHTFVNAREDEDVFELIWALFYERLPHYRSYQQAIHYSWVGTWGILQRDWDTAQKFAPLYYIIAQTMPWPARWILEKRPELLEEEIATRGTPLFMATRDKNSTMVRLFLSLGADVDFHAKVPNMRSPLLVAASNGGDEIFDMLLAAGADLNARGVHGAHAIHEAAQSSAAILALLLKRGIDPGLTCGQGSTPLHYAVTAGTSCFPQIRMLVEAPHHADIFAYNNVVQTPLHIALSLRCIPVLDYLMSKADDLSPLAENKASLLTLEDVQWALSMQWYPKLRAALASREQQTSQDIDISLIDLLQLRLGLSKRMQIPQALVERIMDYASLWTKVIVTKHEPVCITQNDEIIPYLSIPIKRPLRRLVCRFRSHDQGWSDSKNLHGGYNGSYTWFEANIRTKRNLDTDIMRRLLQLNVHASSTFRNHRVILDFNDPCPGVKEWLEMIHVGDVLDIYGIAKYPGWMNYIDYVEADVFYA